MDLNDILNKTKKKSEQIKIVRTPPSIASTDRPYSEKDLPTNQEVISNTENCLEIRDDAPKNWQQSGNKPTTKVATNRQQTDNKPATNRQQESGNWQQSGNQTDNRTDNKLATNWQQTDNKLAKKTTFSMLVGLQRLCLFFIYKSCKANRNKMTEPLTLKHIAEALETSTGAVKTTLQRLEEKECLIRVNFKNGRGGWSIYELPESTFTEMLRYETDNKVTTNWQQTDNKVATKLATKLATNSSSSSSNYINITTTTESSPNELDDTWKQIDITPLENIGFSINHLIQISNQGILTIDIIQDSIYAYAFDLNHNNKGSTIKGSPLNYFMGIIKNGRPYLPPDNYETPQDREMKIYLEKKKKIESERVTREEELLSLSFKEWEMGLSEAEKKELLPKDVRNSLSGHKVSALKTFFKNEIWPKMRLEFQI